MSTDINDRILAAAQSHAWKQGNDFRLEDVAKAAGVSRSTLYRRFANREALVAALAERGVALAPEGAYARALAAMEQVVAAKGLDGLTMEAVADAASLSVPTLYRHFADRAELVGTWIGTRRSLAGLALVDRGDPQAELVAFSDLALEALRKDAMLARAALSGSGDGRALWEKARGPVRELLSGMEDRFRRLGYGDARLRALSLAGLLLTHGALASLVGAAPVTGARLVAMARA